MQCDCAPIYVSGRPRGGKLCMVHAKWIEHSVGVEREACAKFVADLAQHPDFADAAPAIAKLIRER